MNIAEKRSRLKHPDFFNKDRCVLLRQLFVRLDADGELKLDVMEMAPFFHYVFDKFFGVDLNRVQTTALFQLMDVDGDSYICYDEFISFVTTIKTMEYVSRVDPDFAVKAFPYDMVSRSDTMIEKNVWKRSMQRMDYYAIEEAWNILLALKGEHHEGDSDEDEEGDDDGLKRVKELFDNFDVDGNKQIDIEELSEGLIDMRILMNQRQIKMFSEQMDLDGDGFVSLSEFEVQLHHQRELQIRKGLSNEKEEIKAMIRRLSNKVSPSAAAPMQSFADAAAAARAALQDDDDELETEEEAVERLRFRKARINSMASNASYRFEDEDNDDGDGEEEEEVKKGDKGEDEVKKGDKGKDEASVPIKRKSGGRLSLLTSLFGAVSPNTPDISFSFDMLAKKNSFPSSDEGSSSSGNQSNKKTKNSLNPRMFDQGVMRIMSGSANGSENIGGGGTSSSNTSSFSRSFDFGHQDNNLVSQRSHSYDTGENPSSSLSIPMRSKSISGYHSNDLTKK
eukprot:CAMPEP_0114380898 /NCGR_PEP_ID=MMETSP0102-20121206/3134_1 /TAXON_ID=38822 ORGANISM="Pteridomonas danica, Strain PT" /NCGR_SAMPLE_ID=MMETSP0102 /ASSEMBLY_ACC=CAM_ASM_000212 /LENGTH=506 /DNA_ID=CAMNT_0001536289 /DNA_START=2253 /DNA_END=3770 /DNA_ORIENTATION=-